MSNHQEYLYRASTKVKNYMNCIIDLAELEDIVNSLKTTLRQRQPEIVKSCLTKVVENGFASNSDITDIFYYSDNRLDTNVHVTSVERWCEIFSIPLQCYYRRPQGNESFVWGSTGVSTEDLAELLIMIERIGYSIDPLPLITMLLPKLVGRAYVTDAELSILLYEKKRHKMDSIFFRVKSDDKGEGHRKQKLKTATGYKVEVILNKYGKPVQLTIKAPKHRLKPDPKLTVCEACGYEWYRGDPESSAAHRKEHKKRLKYLDPKPNRRFCKGSQDQDDLFPVTANSPRWVHGEIYLRALAFKRELKYDFVQWSYSKYDIDPNDRGYLFINSDNVAVGACAFRLIANEISSYWSLQWVWITPTYRRSGILTKHWKTLRQFHGDFSLENPVSDAMVAFVSKNGDQNLLNIV